ncbi:hypothetical protein CS022_05680 [Veronia nyctiphanis]|uniref:Uncharacterized protein n=1 Tax=Veronia nyctiphanis TaxID=1278244 RepID=A0A4Q0YSI2_9GAMM|nr:hypothetical protein [Veronia nyctiphanis]RXJ74116.1 hypothetical protein CS022_05680 [Veronia nyctiphanis]
MALWKKLVLLIALISPVVSQASSNESEGAWDRALESASLALDAAKDAGENAWVAAKDKSSDALVWLEARAGEGWIVVKDLSDDVWASLTRNGEELWEESKVLQRNFLIEARVTIDKILAPERNIEERHELSKDKDEEVLANQA